MAFKHFVCCSGTNGTLVKMMNQLQLHNDDACMSEALSSTLRSALDLGDGEALVPRSSFKPSIPAELFRPILQFIHPSDFNYNLSLVSRSFKVDVEAHFYKYVAIPEKKLLFFCRTMIARPDLARRVHRLAFTGAIHREPRSGDKEMVGRTMKLLINLKDLSISSSIYIRQEGEKPWPVHHDDVGILYGCTFKLERLACIFTWAEPLAQWLATQPQLTTFEHGGYPRGEVRLDGGSGGSDATLIKCSYLRISPYILSCFQGSSSSVNKPQPVTLRFDMRFNTVQEEFEAARSLREICRNLKCLTLTRHTSTRNTSRLRESSGHSLKRRPN
ncbi:hypothetical protein B0F90DRAFT_1223205 [Multifurca ochricompacta]|uniref:F-box domain-containing protein n=1 Tax=Multifurca ochricompacta TaxID=376703 RepID=A0AAD4LVU5_9AGAM|nr:hypothetical protein B0F90DRAFT_1223205 [Multifurca ochricompacta]